MRPRPGSMSEQTELPSHNQEQIPLQKYLAMKTAQILKRANLQFAVDNFKHKLSSFLILMKGVGRTLRSRGQSSGSNSLKNSLSTSKKQKKQNNNNYQFKFFSKETFIYVLRNKDNPSYFLTLFSTSAIFILFFLFTLYVVIRLLYFL